MSARSPLSVTLSVWQAIFLREAVDRLFGERAAWFWLLIEPVLHIGFFVWVRTVVRVHTMGGIDFTLWLIAGLISFFLFRRTGVQVMHSADSNRPLFVYRQVKPFDAAIARGTLEAFLMILVSAIVLFMAGLSGHAAIPADLLLVLSALFGLWLLGMGYGLTASVLMALVPELEHVLKILMLPLYLVSGVIWPIASIPRPWRDFLMLNPITHGIETVRLGFVPYYHAAPETRLAYLYVFALAFVFFGLLLHRRFALRLVMQ
jgi:capsular polysaccharide transport system permease protein